MLVKIEATTTESNSNDDSNDRISIVQAALKTMSMNRDDPAASTGGVDVTGDEDGMSPIAPSNPAEADLNREENRLATFEQEGSTWPPNAKMEPRKIAKAGLFYTGQYQETKCPWCTRVVTQWDYGEQAIVKHRSLSPDCPFILGTSNNVPLLRMTPSPTPSPALSRSTSTPRDIPDGPAPPAPPQPPPTVQHHQHPVNVESQEYLSEANRFKTFEGRWPLTFIRPADLANAGFIYTGQDDIVQCVFCREFIGRWDEEDFPHTEHRSIYPTCPFVLGQNVGNIPIQTQPYDPFISQDAMPLSQGFDEAGCKEDDSNKQKEDKVLNLIKITDNPTASGSGTTGIIEHSGPATPKYCTVESRVRTFQNWPPELRQRPTEMAGAGFYHITPRGAGASAMGSDKVKCYYCDGGLMNWQSEDDPWTEHARWFNLCGFLRLVKGDDFIREVLLKHPRQPVPELPGVEAMPEPVEMSVKEDQLRNMMSSMLVNQVVEMGITLDRIQSALEKKLRSSGCGYKSARELADAAMKELPEVAPPLTTSCSEEMAAENSQQPSTSQDEPPLLPQPPLKSVEKEQASSSSQAENMDIEESKPEESKPNSLEEEMQRLKDQRLCKVCFVNESSVAFLPCGHLICCVNCVPSLKDCPYCRQPITGTLKTFMS